MEVKVNKHTCDYHTTPSMKAGRKGCSKANRKRDNQ